MLDPKTLNEATQKRLVEVLSKDPNDMTDEDKGFLRARKMYIKNKHIERLPGVFGKDAVKAASKKQTELENADDEGEEEDSALTNHPYVETNEVDPDSDDDDLDDEDVDD